MNPQIILWDSPCFWSQYLSESEHSVWHCHDQFSETRGETWLLESYFNPYRCSYAMLIFSIQMAMAIIMLIYVNLSSDTITWSDLTFNLIYVIHSECHKKPITYYCYHTLRVITEINVWIMIQSKIHCRKSLILAKQRIATNSKRQEMVGLFLPDQKAVQCLKG